MSTGEIYLRSSKMRIDQCDACYSNEANGSGPIPWKTSKPLAAFFRPPWRSCADFEGVIFRALAATKFAPWHPL